MIERSNYNLLKHNTFGLEAQCAKFVEYETADDAVAVAEMLQRSQLRQRHLRPNPTACCCDAVRAKHGTTLWLSA